MKFNSIPILLLVILAFEYSAAQSKKQVTLQDEAPAISFVPHEQNKRIDVMIGNTLFTSYCWLDKIFKPVLYPINSSGGNAVTRGFPLNPHPGERIDHPHQVGLWLTYGDVDGLDFWNNSEAIPADKKNEYGTIKHIKVNEQKGGNGEAILKTTESWVGPPAGGKELLSEQTDYHFIAKGSARIIDRITTLTATNKTVSMKDNKEGMIGIRVARQLELPSKEELVLTDAKGNPTTVAKMTNEGVTGNYRSSEGITGEAVWSTRARWMELSGTINNEKVALVMFDHPKNQSYPTYWHARGYGLFAANPLGWNVFSNGKETLNFSLPKGKSVIFRYRILIQSGDLTDAQINSIAEEFAKKY
jgi:hypothetical protein